MPQVTERPLKRAKRSRPDGVNFSVRMSRELKSQSEEVYHALGVPLTTAINAFLVRSVAVRGFPFDMRLCPPPVPDMATMTDAEFDAELQKGYDEAVNGRLVDAHKAHERLNRRIASWSTSQM